MLQQPELLAPAGSLETLKYAVMYGADAVYCALPEFGMRAAPVNLTVGELHEGCIFAHARGKKVYLTLNTLPTNEELSKLPRYIQDAAEAGVDAFIIADLGVLALAKKYAPQVERHVSTQAGITNYEAAKVCYELGAKRVVLARELPLTEIAQIRDNCPQDLELEAFVHGAMCMSVSGRCLLSNYMIGRDANRGECAQPCRMKYRLVDADGAEISAPAHFLSLRDMNRSAYVGDMLDAGVRSFKIEGRLKDAAYVKNVVAHYREILDAEIAARGLLRTSFGESETSFSPDLSKTFNRGFTEYHLNGTSPGCAGFESPKSKGEFLGTVEKCIKNGFFFRGADKVFHNGDGLFFDSCAGLFPPFGASVGGVRENEVFLGKPGERVEIPRGARIWRNFDIDFSRRLKPLSVRRMAVCFKVWEDGDHYGFEVKLCDSRAVSAELLLPKADAVLAQNPLASKEKIASALCKLGGTNYKCLPDGVLFDCRSVPFFNPARINDIRRRLIELLESSILDGFARAGGKIGTEAMRAFSPPKSLASAIPTDFSANVLNRAAANFYADAGVKLSEFAAESGKVGLVGRRVMSTKHCILRELGMCKKKVATTFKEPLRLLNEDVELEVKLNCAKCECELFLISSRRACGRNCMR